MYIEPFFDNFSIFQRKRIFFLSFFYPRLRENHSTCKDRIKSHIHNLIQIPSVWTKSLLLAISLPRQSYLSSSFELGTTKESLKGRIPRQNTKAPLTPFEILSVHSFTVHSSTADRVHSNLEMRVRIPPGARLMFFLFLSFPTLLNFSLVNP